MRLKNNLCEPQDISSVSAKVNNDWVRSNNQNLYDYFMYSMELDDVGKKRFGKYKYYRIDYDEFVENVISIQVYSDSSFILKYTIIDFTVDDPSNSLCYDNYLTWVRENKINKIV